mgnify:CR=1 FL=1
MFIQPDMSGMSFLCRLRASVKSFPLYVALASDWLRRSGERRASAVVEHGRTLAVRPFHL